MSGASSLYEALPSATSIRVLVLGPGETDDEDIFCWLLPSDLDQDHEKFPDSTPRPTESISIATGKTSSGEDRTFLIPFDVDFGFDQPSAQASHESRMHPFQRYEALSYVWGDNSKPRYIFCNGEELFPVTQNLYAALRSLRLPQQGRRLWIDAICINQADHEEKGAQIGLMDRVYQQASKVIAFLPLSEQDAGNILELVPKVWRAREEYEQKRKERETGMTSQPGDMASLNSVTALETIRIPVAAEEQRGITSILQEQQSRRGGGNFLEDFGIPPLDSPLWVSWQRLFASSYFRRIWILQEFALGKNLHFWFGSRGERAELVMLAKHFLAAYGGTQSSEYMSAGSRRDEDDFTELARRAGEGSNNAGKMFTERVFTQDGSIHRRLIDILSTTLGFQATDQRDKIYALLGLALDGAYFAQHVSYAPEETPAKTFTRFARLFIEKGEGHELLLQAGLEHDQQLPSWVPVSHTA
ncbi:heterokaryon incompatibility protein-domain-containing protein [Truncatella angustata]|uniref:Heterokaryon incompatibility protein-domain-containing protein n=1 Tax=Truncatella angustata TaxID=152316 RepID=A0A9P8UUF5_9PEZI|nr:heterokaryon incompatibility protein-domain-containing protein [Truncatella angustata]KAH6658526.1 heterokaryon incompatibility protein-domain-containing protein [Truncatella angustata]